MREAGALLPLMGSGSEESVFRFAILRYNRTAAPERQIWEKQGIGSIKEIKMERTVLNGKFILSYPEEFQRMEESDLRKLTFLQAPAIALRDSDRHMVITAGWKKAGIACLMLSTEEIAGKTEKTIRAAMAEFGYQLEGFSRRMIGGRKAEGFRYRYTARDVGMIGESFVMKNRGSVYNIHLYTRDGLLYENLPSWESILDSIRWEA